MNGLKKLALELPYQQMVIAIPNRQGRRWDVLTVNRQTGTETTHTAERLSSVQAHDSIGSWVNSRYLMGFCYPACTVQIQGDVCHVISLIEELNLFDLNQDLDDLLREIEGE